jgi:putative transposase
MKAIDTSKEDKLASLAKTCSYFGIQRDAYYKYQKRFDKQKTIDNQVIMLVKENRRTLPRKGTRKLITSLGAEFEKNNIKIGIDQLLNVLRDNNIPVKRKKYSCRTTNSYHRFHKYKNIIIELEITRPNQVWASNINYIRTIKGFCYLALITDMYSRKIIGLDPVSLVA